jgi:hypothetical protein
MTENTNASPEEQKQKASTEGQDPKLALLLALIEHGSRPLAILLVGLAIVAWLTWAKEPLFQFLNRTQNLKLGSFELQIQAQADALNLGDALQNLRELSPDQMALFLVIGRDRQGRNIHYRGPEVNEENLQALKQAGLINNYQKEAEGGFTWRVSSEGNRLYDIISANIQIAINSGVAPASTP